MQTRKTKTIALMMGGITVLTLVAGQSHAASVKVEAETGTIVSGGFTTGTDSGLQYITVATNVSATTPTIAARVVTFNLTFPEAGNYKLFAHVRVGSGGANDDSFFYANGFGTKSPSLDSDWITMNNLVTAGYTTASSVVTNNGSAGTLVWKWVNLSDFSNGGEAPIAFMVSAGNLSQTFQIGGREDGLWIDALMFGTSNYTFTVADLDAGGPGSPLPPPPVPAPKDFVAGNLIQFNDNGTWSWYMDERAIVDVNGGKLVQGSDASGAGTGGTIRDSAVEAVIYDLSGGAIQRTALLPASGELGPDDHNAPGLLLRPDGKYLAQWTGHNDNFLSYFRVYDGTNWGSTNYFDWASVGAVSGEQASYSNPHYLSAENRTFTIVRSLDIKSMNILVSSNYGDTWTYYGKLNRRYPSAGYNPGYYRFSDNGVDRIDFICTESHPRDTLTSIYHGYISNGMSFRSDGTVVDSNLNDTNAPLSSDFTLIFANGTVLPPGQTNYRCWNSDVQWYSDGTVQAIIHARINQFDHPGGYPDTEDPDHAFFFCRYDRTNWSTTYLCQAGFKLYPDEADYTGLGCLNPGDPNTIYISTKYDPRAVQSGVTDTNQQYSSFREIWKGVTTNHGASFTWTPVTRDSAHDNFRPIIPKWDANNNALLWLRGKYNTAQSFDAAVVGRLDRHGETTSPMTYVDADTTNTSLATGAPFLPGNSANQWHERIGSGNGGSVFASADVSAEDAPALKTSVVFPTSGTYDVWINFWGNPAADWRIMGGLATNALQLFRGMACKEVEPGDHTTTLVLSNSTPNQYLYQAYVGRVTGNSADVYVDDNDILTGTAGTTAGDTVRTWYDGVSFARVDPFQLTGATNNGGGSVTVSWNSIPPTQTLSTLTYTVQKKNSLNDVNWTTIATGLPSVGATTSYTDTGASGDTAFYRVTSP